MDSKELKYLVTSLFLVVLSLSLIGLMIAYNLIPQEQINYLRLSSLGNTIQSAGLIILWILITKGGGFGVIHNKIMGFWEKVYFYVNQSLIYYFIIYHVIYGVDFLFSFGDIAIAQAFPGFYWKVHLISFIIMLFLLLNTKNPNSGNKIYMDLLNKVSSPLEEKPMKKKKEKKVRV